MKIIVNILSEFFLVMVYILSYKNIDSLVDLTDLNVDKESLGKTVDGVF